MEGLVWSRPIRLEVNLSSNYVIAGFSTRRFIQDVCHRILELQ